jgi:hypothetical protein
LKDENEKKKKKKMIELLDGEIEKKICSIKNGQKNIVNYIRVNLPNL